MLDSISWTMIPLPFWWLGYLVICLPFSLLWTFYLPRFFAKDFRVNFAIFYIFSASFFPFGLVLTALLLITIISVTHQVAKKQSLAMIDIPSYQRSPIKVEKNYGESFGTKAISENQLPKAVREKMLVAVNQFNAASVHTLNAKALSDDTDEMRLYAQSLIEKRDRFISTQLRELNNFLSEAKDPMAKALCYKQLAEILWEKIYNYLVNNELIPSVLEKITGYALDAYEVLPDDVELPIILTKVSLKQRNLAEAKKWVAIAIQNEAPQYKTMMFEAEIAFIEKNYALIGEVIAPHGNLNIGSIQPIMSFWANHD